MRAVTCSQGHLEVADIAEPEPGPGHLLVEVHRCGICGSDLHARTHADATAEVASAVGYDGFMRSTDRVVMGHEFSGTVLRAGPGARHGEGTRVVAMPIIRHGRDVHLTGLAQAAPGGYAERVLVQDQLAFEVPDGLDLATAALTEPLAVALHAVRRGAVGRSETAVVVGCGPIGLAVILMLKAQGRRTVIASDYSAKRRELARACGADVVVDPAVESPWHHVQPRRGTPTDAPALFDLAIDSMDKLRKVPLLPWWRLLQGVNRAGLGPSGPVVFECVGVPGVIDDIVMQAPLRSKVVVVGVCMETDAVQPAMAVNKELDLRFAFGYDPGEFRETLHLIADGTVDPTPLVTGTVGLDEVPAMFETLGRADEHAKVLVDPSR